MKLSTLSLKTKLISGFTAILVLLFVISLTSFYALKGASTGFEHYREMARETNLAGRLQANMLMVRMDVKSFLISGSKEILTDFDERWKLMMQFQAQAHKDIHDPERAAKIDEVEDALEDYYKGFGRVVKYKDQRNKLVNDVLNVQGAVLEKSLTDIMISANTDDDATAAFHAGMAMRDLLLARLYVVKFLNTNDSTSVDRVHKELEEMDKGLSILDKEIETPNRRELLATIQNAKKTYLSAFDELVSIIANRNDVINNTLDILGRK